MTEPGCRRIMPLYAPSLATYEVAFSVTEWGKMASDGAVHYNV
jgi:hypothetical protein